MNPISSILRQSTKKIDEPYIILTGPCHEAYETNLCKANVLIYGLNHKGFKTWNPKYRPLPKNYIPVDSIPDGIQFDLVLSQNKFGQYQVLSDIARALHLPLISLEHTLPVPMWGKDIREGCVNMRGDLNVFISEYSINEWQFNNFDPSVRVVKHGVDTEQFKPDESKERKPHIFSCVNDWVNRDWCCGFTIWQKIVNGNNPLPTFVLGDTPGLSVPASSTEELINAYQTSAMFLNTSTISPVPTVLLEAMACGTPVVTTATCMIPEIIENGVNGLMSNDINELRSMCELVLNDTDLAKKLGENARKTIVEKFNANRFAEDWNKLFLEASEVIYRG